MSFARSAEYTFLSSPDVPGIGLGIRVKLDAATGFILPAEAEDIEVGVVENSNENAPVASYNPDGTVAANNGSKRPLRVRLWNAPGTTDVATTGAIEAGERVKRAAGGRVARWDAPLDAEVAPYGFAMGPAVAPFDIIEVLPIPGAGGGSAGGGTLTLEPGVTITGGSY